MRDQRGQALLVLVAALLAVLVGAFVVGSVARGLGDRADHLSAADLAALAGARAMRDAYPRLFEPPRFEGRLNPNASGTRGVPRARRRGSAGDGSPQRRSRRARVVPARRSDRAGADPCGGRRFGGRARRGVGGGAGGRGGGAEPAEQRARLRRGWGRVLGAAGVSAGQADAPDVAAAFDRLAAAARRDGHRADRRQRLSQRRRAGRAVRRAIPTRSGSRRRAPRCTAWAPSSTSARRPPTAGLAPTRPRFHFVKRYSWEPWHWGFVLNAGQRVGRLRRATVMARAAARRCRASCPRALRAAVRARGAALERLGGAAGRAGVEGVELQPVRTLGRRCAGHRAVHARHRTRVRLGRPVRSGTGDRCPGAPDARPAASLRVGAARAGGLQRRPRVAWRRACASRRIPETQAYVAAILGMLRGAGDQAGAAAGGALGEARGLTGRDRHRDPVEDRRAGERLEQLLVGRGCSSSRPHGRARRQLDPGRIVAPAVRDRDHAGHDRRR